MQNEHLTNNIFTKYVTKKDFNEILQAYSIELDILLKLSKVNIDIIKIVTPYITLESNLKDWLNGSSRTFKREYKTKKIRFLPIKFMKENK